MKLIQVQTCDVPQFDVLEVVPASRVPGIEIRCVAGQPLYLKPLSCRTRQVFRYRRPPVDGRAIPDDQQTTPGIAHQVLKEGDGVQTIEGLRPHQDVDLSLRRRPPMTDKVVAPLPRIDYRCLALRAIRLDHPRQQVEARFIHENQGRMLAAGPFAEERPRFLSSADDGFLVALDGPVNEDLRSPTQLLQETRYVTLAVGDAELFFENLGNAGACPDIAAKTIGFGAMPQEVGHESSLRVGPPGRASRNRLRQQGVRSLSVGGGQPAADSGFRGAQGGGDVSLRPAPLAQVPGLHTPPLSAVERVERFSVHIPFEGTETLLLYATVSKRVLIARLPVAIKLKRHGVYGQVHQSSPTCLPQ